MILDRSMNPEGVTTTQSYKICPEKIKFKKLNNLAKLPYQADPGSAGWDLYAATSYDIEIEPHKTVKIGTGLAMELPVGTFGAIFARSGLATKRGLRPINCTGVIDSSYRGELVVALHNDTNESQVVEAGERIAQLVLLPYIPMEFEEVDELSDTERGSSGFGDSGKH